jgi:Ca2+-binding RTX toxin-like protein
VTLATLSDAAGVRTVTATAGTASTIDIGGTAAGVTVTTNAGNDTVTAGSGANSISTGDADDLVKFLSANFTLADTVAGDAGADTIQVTDNATVVDADFTNVTSVETLLMTGTGAQNVTLATLSDAAGVRTVTATAGTASTIDIGGTAAGVTVTTNAGSDVITVGGGKDSVSTGVGNDTIIAGLAVNFNAEETLTGGAGIDTLRLDQAATYAANKFTPTVTQIEIVALNQAAAGFSLTFDNLTYVGVDADGDGTEDNTITVKSLINTTFGINVTAGSTNSNHELVIEDNTFLDGADTIIGGAGNDTIQTGAGDDTITGGAGSDSIVAGSGDDTIVGDQTDVLLDGGSHTTRDLLQVGANFNDIDDGQIVNIENVALTASGLTLVLSDQTEGFNISGHATGSSTIIAGIGNDSITGGDAADSIVGGGGADTLNGGAGNDDITVGTNTNDTETVNVSVLGGAGNDIIKIELDELTLNDVITGGSDTDTLQFLTVGTLVDADFTNVTTVEKLILADGINNLTLGNEAYNGGNGVSTVVGGSGNDTIITYSNDDQRGSLTLDLSAGGKDTLQILNASIGGAGGASVPATLTINEATLNQTLADWAATNATVTSRVGTDALTVSGFQVGDGGDQIEFMDGASAVVIGGFANNVDLTFNNLAGLSNYSVIELNANQFQQSDPYALLSMATMMDQLNNVQDGNYYVVVYDGTGAAANAFIYAATATEGDGFDFADVNAGTNGNDLDTVELIGILTGVGANNVTSQNFI